MSAGASIRACTGPLQIWGVPRVDGGHQSSFLCRPQEREFTCRVESAQLRSAMHGVDTTLCDRIRHWVPCRAHGNAPLRVCHWGVFVQGERRSPLRCRDSATGRAEGRRPSALLFVSPFAKGGLKGDWSGRTGGGVHRLCCKISPTNSTAMRSVEYLRYAGGVLLLG